MYKLIDSASFFDDEPQVTIINMNNINSLVKQAADDRISKTKICSKCQIEKQLIEFYKKNTGKFGVTKLCKICWSIDRKLRYKNNKDKELSKNKNWIEKNKIKHSNYLKNYYSTHKEDYHKRTVIWQKAHPEYLRYRQSLKRALLKTITPKWADLKAIRCIYKQAQELTNTTGKVYHVDHIIPIRGKFASGLHVESNLQIITAEENLYKSNKHYV